ncbi:MAG TPA: hypothetical protein VMM36_06095 [Opitutaceae bacterium]|nr:hypothetical protein [Opitutaceae bacterium]
MGVREIQQAARNLPAAERRMLTTWMVREFPALSIENLFARRTHKAGAAAFEPPTTDNFPTGATLAHAKRTANRLGIAK